MYYDTSTNYIKVTDWLYGGRKRRWAENEKARLESDGFDCKFEEKKVQRRYVFCLLRNLTAEEKKNLEEYEYLFTPMNVKSREGFGE